jgi:hypothetical protein
VRPQAATGLQAVEEGTPKVLDRGGDALRRAEDVLQETLMWDSPKRRLSRPIA